MATNGFLPRTDSEKETWLKNFANKIGTYNTKYNIAASEVADVKSSLLHFSYNLNFKTQQEDYTKKLKAYILEIKDGLPAGASASVPPVFPVFPAAPPVSTPGIFKRIIALGRRIKAHTAYTVADGFDLGIEIPTSKKVKPNSDFVKPIISVKLIDGGHPEINWKRNSMDALEIWVDRDDDKGFVLCEVDIKPNYTDEYPLPVKAALWRYKAIYRLDNKAVGKWSDIVSITVVKL
jgi:hypothetical protein